MQRFLPDVFAATQCNAMQCGVCKGVIYCVYVCIRLIEIGDCRAVVLGRGALRRGWVAGLGRRVVFIVYSVACTDALVGLGEWECVSLHLHLFLTLSVAFTCFGFFPWSSSVCRVSDRNSRLQSRGTIELSRADHGVGWMNVIHGTRLAGCRCRCRG